MKIILGFLVVITLAVGGYWLNQPEEPTFVPVPDNATLRKTTSGNLLGYTGANGAWIWRGIRYAKAPKGTLRWRAPLPPKAPRKGGIIETLASGSACPQLPSTLSEDAAPGRVTVGSEDCLFMNIYAPPNAENAPVMLWLHGGGNTIGEGASYSGENLAIKHGVIVVTINYRLGLFGWFSHPSLSTGNPKDDSGNYGTLDVIRGLEWVRNNIESFGGNPSNVTLFGESAGAFDTLAMMASPLAEGLFHRAIVQSGGFETTPMAVARNTASNGGHAFSSAEILTKLLVADGTVGRRDGCCRVRSRHVQSQPAAVPVQQKTRRLLRAFRWLCLWHGQSAGQLGRWVCAAKPADGGDIFQPRKLQPRPRDLGHQPR
jgi:para-nitrobenzyl esterase